MKTTRPGNHPSSPFSHALPSDDARRRTARLRFSHIVMAVLAMLPLTAAGRDPARVPLSVFCLEYSTSLKSVYLKVSGHEYAKVDLSTANVVAAGEAPLVDGSVLLYGPPKKVNDYPVVASAKTGAIRKPLMVLVPNPQTAEPGYQSTVVDMDTDKFPLGSYQIVNLSPHPVRFKTGERAKEIAPHSNMLFNPDLKAGDVVPVTIEYKPGNDWLVVSSSRWAGRKDRRSLVCVHLNPQTKRMLVKSIPLRE